MCFKSAAVAWSFTTVVSRIVKRRFEAWAVEDGKSYNTLKEKEKRFKFFRDKLRAIERHNFKFPDCCKRELTKFSDQAWEEEEKARREKEEIIKA
ncbi:putative actinidain [Helianthus anomalus]